MCEVKEKARDLWIDFIYDIVSGFLQAIGIHCFINSIDIAPGGSTGLSIIANRLTNLPIGTLGFLINVPLLIASWIYLGKIKTVKTVKTVFIMTVILDCVVTPFIPVYMGDKMVSCIFGGVFAGTAMALVLMRGSTTGGGDIVAKLLQKFRPHMQTGAAIRAVNLVIVASSMLLFRNIEAGLYGLINMGVVTWVIDAILYGMNKSTMVTVLSAHYLEISEQFMLQLGHGCTFLKSRGAYSESEGEALICVVDRKQFYKVKKIVYGIDRKAFMIASEAKEVYGKGFLDYERDV